MINITSNWLRFDAFLRGPAESRDDAPTPLLDSTSRLHGAGYGCHAHAKSEHGKPWRYTIRGVSLAGMTSAALHARENASMPPRESPGRLGPIGKTGISITASSISSHSLTAVLVRLTTGHCSLATRHYHTDHASLAPRPLPSAGNWVRFSCSIPPLFVLSHSLPMINTTGKLASFWRFSIAASSLPSASRGTDHRPLFPRHSPLPPRHPPEPAGSGRAATLPHWLLPDTDRRFVKVRTGSNLDERPLYIQYVTEPGDSCGKINPFLPTRCRPTVKHSLAAGDAQRQWLQARLPHGHQPQCPFSP